MQFTIFGSEHSMNSTKLVYFWFGLVRKVTNPSKRDVPSMNSTCIPSGNPNYELTTENRKSHVLLCLLLFHCYPLRIGSLSLPFVLVFLCNSQEHCLSFPWFRLGMKQSLSLGQIICHRWLFKQLLMPSVCHVAWAKLSPNPTMRRSSLCSFITHPLYLMMSMIMLTLVKSKEIRQS